MEMRVGELSNDTWRDQHYDPEAQCRSCERAVLGLTRVAFWGIVRQIKGLCFGLPMLCLAAQIFSGCAIPAAQAAPAAFPGAQGGGAVSVGGRGGSVFNVTNLNDSGPGSLRECATASGPRTCIFRVGGTIRFRTPLYIRNPFITIAGQTAPGGGILLRGTSMDKSINDSSMIQIWASDVIIRYLRVRVGAGDWPAETGRGVSVRTGSRIMLDHLSISWSPDDTVELWDQRTGQASAKNYTLSNSIISEGLSEGKGVINGTNSSSGGIEMTNNS
jgi:hypothetical protein